MTRLLRVVLVVVALLVLPAEGRGAAPFSHADFSAVLARWVDATGRVDYRGIADDPTLLDRYLAAVGQTSPEREPARFPRREEQLAYYLNAYNAFAIRGVTRRPGIPSVDAVKQDFFVRTRWNLGGRAVSLAELEDSLVRRQFKDPRVHFALNCQSAGCPRLPREAFEPDRLEAQLEAVTREFCTDRARVTVDPAGVAHISQIFQWYAGDFAAAGGAVAFIVAHGGVLPPDARVEFIPYDWSLSAQPGRRP